MSKTQVLGDSGTMNDNRNKTQLYLIGIPRPKRKKLTKSRDYVETQFVRHGIYSLSIIHKHRKKNYNHPIQYNLTRTSDVDSTGAEKSTKRRIMDNASSLH